MLLFTIYFHKWKERETHIYFLLPNIARLLLCTSQCFTRPPPPPRGIALELILREINSTCIPLPHAHGPGSWGAIFNKFHCPHEEQIAFADNHTDSSRFFR